MTFAQVSMRWVVLAAVAFCLSLSDSTAAKDFVSMEDATKLEKPTICLDRSAGLYLIDWDGQNRRLWMTGDFNGPARFSRDGKRASFIAKTPDFGWYTHYILELETGRLINMTERLDNNGYEHIYAKRAWWFPDGRRLLYSASDKNSPVVSYADLYILDFRKATLDQITKTPFKDEFWASISGDGKRIAFSGYPLSDEEKALFDLDDHSFDHLYTMNANGTGVVNLTRSSANENYPEWSPDGKKIAFQAGGRPEQEGEMRDHDLFIMDPNGSNVERLTSRKDGMGVWVQDWSSDSKWVLFSMTQDGQWYYLYRIHIETREMARITGGGSATWVHAGKSRFLSVDPAGKKKAQWGQMKAAGGSENSQAGQETSPEE